MWVTLDVILTLLGFAELTRIKDPFRGENKATRGAKLVVNFNNSLVQRTNLLVLIIWENWFYHQNSAQLNLNP